MRKIIALFLISSIALSCSNRLEFNKSAFQGTKNYGSWVAANFQATITDDGGLKMIAINNSESLTISVESINTGTYNLQSSSDNYAEFDTIDFVTYSTFNNGDGEIVIEDYDIVNLTVTGTFKFNAYSSSGEIVNFIEGIFYKVPILGLNETTGFLGSNSFGATVNSNNLEIATVETSITTPILTVKGTFVDGAFIEIFILEDVSVGSHTLNFSSQTYANYVFTDGVIASSQYGTLTILEHDTQFNRIKATFLFNTGSPHNIEVSNGNFIVYY